MNELSSLALGFLVGAIFAIFALPVPAPANLAGVLGIVGLTVGYALVRSVL